MRQGPGEVDLISPLGARVQVLSREIGACWFIFRASLVALAVKINLPVQEMQEMWVQSLGQGRSPGGGNGNPL